MFHLRDGLFFGRTPDGGVRIVKTYDGRDVRPDNVVMDITTDKDGFASVMASMCAFGETAETWEEARNFLARPYPGDDGAYKIWRDKNPGLQAPLCSCVARCSDDNHGDNCEFWKFVLNLRSTWPGEK